jgi:hypothetical protein
MVESEQEGQQVEVVDRVRDRIINVEIANQLFQDFLFPFFVDQALDQAK